MMSENKSNNSKIPSPNKNSSLVKIVLGISLILFSIFSPRLSVLLGTVGFLAYFSKKFNLAHRIPHAKKIFMVLFSMGLLTLLVYLAQPHPLLKFNKTLIERAQTHNQNLPIVETKLKKANWQLYKNRYEEASHTLSEIKEEMLLPSITGKGFYAQKENMLLEVSFRRKKSETKKALYGLEKEALLANKNKDWEKLKKLSHKALVLVPNSETWLKLQKEASANLKLIEEQEKAQAEKERKKKERREKRRIRREKKAERKRKEERRATSQRSRRSSAPAQRIRCRDGSYSPTCKCGYSRRGCCSRHGGVAGCG